MRTRVIGLGNTILTDDGAGIYAAREVRRRLAELGRTDAADVVETEVAGFALIELMTGWDRVILIDSIQFDGVRAGTVLQIQPENLRTSPRLRSVHEIDLPTCLELGRRLGFEMPKTIRVFGIQAEDLTTFGESLTARVDAGMNYTADQVIRELESQSAE